MNTVADSTIIHLPISALIRSPHNMRQAPLAKDAKTQRKRDVEAMAASILSQGILQNLVVHPVADDDSLKAVSAGWTRCEAVQLLVKKKKWPEERLLPCKLIGEADAINASLSENIQRSPAHPADEFEAFSKLRAGGLTVEQIALQYGTSAQLVMRRLALADVSPRFMTMFRKGEIKLEEMMAFTLTTDHLWQEKVWDSLPKHYRNAYQIRAELTKEELPASHKLVRFVTVETYEKAGGVIRRDLFANDDGECFLADRALLLGLANQKLEAAAEEVRAEGFAWVIAQPELSHSDRGEYETVPMLSREPTKKEQKQLDSLTNKIQKIDAKLAEFADSDEDDSDNGFRNLETERDGFEDQLARLYESLEEPNPAFASVLGAIVHVSHSGEIAVERSLVKKSDRLKLAKINAENSTALETLDGEPVETTPNTGFSERLNRTLTAHVNAALQVSLLQQPHLAFAALAYSMVKDVFGRFDISSVAHIHTTTNKLTDFIPEQTPALVSYSDHIQQLSAQLPEEVTLDWLCNQSTDFLLAIITAGIAGSVYVVRGSNALDDEARTLARHAQLDMRKWWQANPDSVFNHVPKQTLANIATRLGHPGAATAILKAKKTEAVALTQAKCDTKDGWLPDVMMFE